MKKDYLFHDVEPQVQRIWEEQKTFKVVEDPLRRKFYCLSMAPYPSGNLHMGHVRNYTIGDVISRFNRMLGKNVLQPVGWDAFGLPAENAALSSGVLPSVWTRGNIAHMREQLKSLGFAYDWDREIVTCDPDYYRWEQWFFTTLFRKGMIYRRNSEVNWCEEDRTVLANEQVISGNCWRCGSKVSSRSMSQWFIRITRYSEELLRELDCLSGWPDKVKLMQRNWIGRCEGLEVDFKVVDSDLTLQIYTDHPELIMGVTYVVLTRNHPLIIGKLKENAASSPLAGCSSAEIDLGSSHDELCGGMPTDVQVVHPCTGELLSVWMVDRLSKTNYNTESRMAIPGHDLDDWKFARRHSLPIRSVVLNPDGSSPNNGGCTSARTGILFNSAEFSGLDLRSAAEAVTEKLTSRNAGRVKIRYRLHDWNVSRQRYWGTPIPVLTLEDGMIVPVPEDQLPVILPEDVTIDEMKINPLKEDPEWSHVRYLDRPALRETDTLDTFVESSWYYARYTCPRYDAGMLDVNAADYWLPIDQYVGGVEHATMHLMYFRFCHKLMRDAGLVVSSEPARRLLCQGMVVTETFYRLAGGRKVWVSPDEIQSIVRDENSGRVVDAVDNLGNRLIYAGLSKMSKSRNNGVDPGKIIGQYGADALRLFLMFAAPPEATLEWNVSGIRGTSRFIRRLWRLVYGQTSFSRVKLDPSTLGDGGRSLLLASRKTVRRVTDDIERRQTFNTAISAIMELVGKVERFVPATDNDRALLREVLSTVIRLLYPFTPHVCFVLWKELGYSGSIDDASWPEVERMAESDRPFLVQVDGKLRDRINLPSGTKRGSVIKKIIRRQTIRSYLERFRIKRLVYLPGRLINLVTGDRRSGADLPRSEYLDRRED